MRAHVAESLAERGSGGRRGRAVDGRREAHGREGDEDGEIAGAVQEETRRLSDRGHEAARDRRSHDPRRVEDRCVQGDRAGEVARSDHLDQERLPRRQVDGPDDAEREREDADQRDGRTVRHHQDAEGDGQEHRRRLRDHHQAVTADPVCQHAGERRHERDGKERGRRHRAERERRAREPEDEPALGDRLHPEPDQRDALTEHVAAEVGVPQRREAPHELWDDPSRHHLVVRDVRQHPDPLAASPRRRTARQRSEVRQTSAIASRCAVRVPKVCSSTRARLRYRWASPSHV